MDYIYSSTLTARTTPWTEASCVHLLQLSFPPNQDVDLRASLLHAADPAVYSEPGKWILGKDSETNYGATQPN